MSLQQRISTFSKLGELFTHIGNRAPWPGFEAGLGEEEYNEIENIIRLAEVRNPWFTEENIRRAFIGLGTMLSAENLEKWTSDYDLSADGNKRIGIIMAGNIPLVGFHDLLCVLISGNKAVIKLSSDDEVLPEWVIRTLGLLSPEMKEQIVVPKSKLGDVDAVIATGSNNSARYFEHYFGHLPLLIRKNRNSIAVIEGDESKEELSKLGADLFNFFGLGCRSITKILVPTNYNLDKLFESIFDFGEVINHNKYANNYDYNKAVWLLNREELLDNGFLLLKRDKEICSPTGSLYYDYYESPEQVASFIAEREEELQCVVGRKYIPFGQAQYPELWDYADGVDTLSWVLEMR